MLKLFFGAAFIVVMCSCTTLSPTSREFYRVAGKANSRITKAIPVRSGGVGGMLPNKIRKYDGTFYFSEPMTIEQGRKFVLRAAQIALDTFNSDQAVQEYLEDVPFTEKNLMVFIFVNPKENCVIDPTAVYLACLVNGKLIYESKNYGQNTYLKIFEETYEEALQRFQECEGNSL